MLSARYLRMAVAVGFMLLLGRAATAQNCVAAGTTYTCHANLPHTAEFAYSGLIAGDVFRLYVNNAQIGPDAPAENGAAVQIVFGATLPVGSYTVAVSAWRGGQEARSAPVTMVLVNAPPSTPNNLHIVEINMRVLDQARATIWERTVFSVIAGQ